MNVSMTAAGFSTGEIVAGRYRIVRLLGEGGMGAVYEAMDLEFGESVALKTVLPAAARQAKALERFKREIQIARKVTHPNVCRIFDVGYHAPDGGEENARIAFVTMELLRGETLSGRIRRAGPMSAAEATPIVAQLADGLAAAHRLGIVHRDFKSANIMLVEGGAERVVITDFGLAQIVSTSDAAFPSLTTTGAVPGTPAYMAPEQVEGGEITPSVDIYALGCVMYELVTGCLPFYANSPFAVAIKRLHEPAPSPRELTPELDPRFEAVTLTCLARRPEDRYARVEDVAAALKSSGEVNTLRLSPAAQADVRTVASPIEASTLVQAIPEPPKSRHLVRLFTMLLAAMAISLATFFIPSARLEMNRSEAARRIAARPSIAVFEPQNASGRASDSWIGVALQSYLALALEDDRRLRVAPAEVVAEAAGDLRVASVARLSEETLRAIRLRLGADHVVSGEYTADESGELKITVRLADKVFSHAGNTSQLDRLALAAARDLRTALRLPAPDPTVVHADAVFPRGAAARAAFFEGLQRFRSFDAAGAVGRLTAAVSADPNFAPAHFALAEALATLGYDARARAEAKTAVELATWVPRAERLRMQARRLELSHEWTDAAKIWTELATAHPDVIEYGVRLANAATLAGDGKRAVQAVTALRRLPTALASDPRVDLAEARAAEALGDYAMKDRAARRAASTATIRHARLDLARARHLEGMAAHGTGRYDDALNAYSAARQLFAAAGARDDAAWSTNAIALLLADQNDAAGAMKMLEESLGVFLSTGNRRLQAATSSDMAILAYRQSDFAEARNRWERALSTQREAGDREGEAMTLNNLGSLESELGRLDQARTLFEQALAVGRSVGDRWGTANTLANLSRLLLATGDVSRSRLMLDEAITLFREVSHQQALIAALADSGTLRLQEGMLPEAKKELEESEALSRRGGDKVAIATARARIAEVQLEQGDLDACARSVEESLALATESSDKLLQAEVMAIDGERLRLRGEGPSAKAAFAKALALRTETGDTLGAARVRLAMAALALDGSRFTEALGLAAEARKECRTRRASLDEATAEILTTRAHALLGEVAAAKASAARANALLDQHPSPFHAAALQLASALISVEGGHQSEGRLIAEQALAAARAKGWARIAHECLATLRIVRERSHQAPGPAEVAAAQDLAARGLKLR
jgi:serine/threonine protein kinase/tetratricopeptide (TPR) repeat protein